MFCVFMSKATFSNSEEVVVSRHIGTGGSDTRDARALRLLLKLLEAKEESVVIHAIESLDALFFAGYIHDARPIVVALGEGFEPSTRTIKLMAATLVRKCGQPNNSG